MRRLAIAVAAMLVAATAGAQMYRWADKDGKVHYTDTPPPSSARGVQKRAGPPAPAEAGPAAPYAVQQAARNFPVFVYTAPNCGQPCTDGKALLVDELQWRHPSGLLEHAREMKRAQLRQLSQRLD